MGHLSEKTKQLIEVIAELAHTLDFNIGECLHKKRSGDMGWWLLTDEPDGLDHMYILIVTPHCILAEYNLEDERELSAITDVGLLMEHLQNLGYRRLSSKELRYFTRGGGQVE